MTLLYAALVVCAVAASAGAANTCEGRYNDKIKLFNNQTVYLALPCKYWALKSQKCGPYRLTLSPGNVWLGKMYRTNTIWLSVYKYGDSSVYWDGRLTNKQVVKYINVYGTANERELFTKKNGNLATKNLFNQGLDDYGPYVEDKGKNFRISFSPWDPRRAATEVKYRHSTFKFTCNTDDALEPYPKQICGNTTKEVIANRGRNDFNLKGSGNDLRELLTIYYDVFTNTDVVQVDDKCIEAVSIINSTNCTTQERTMKVIATCGEILGEIKHTTCVTAYSCDPMDIFNACLKWGCSGAEGFEKEYEEECQICGEGTDLCPTFQSVYGNLTGHIQSAKCYKDFLPIAIKKKKRKSVK
ncbi:hypothetical protein ACOMHN_049583 [Nucella lapillus]